MLKRLPSFANILPLYSVIAAMTYGWTISKFLWKLPSWLLFLNIGEALALFAYAMVSALVESLLILGILLLASLVLPAKFFKDEFIIRGAWFVMVAYGAMMIYLSLYTTQGQMLGAYWTAWFGGLLSLAVLAAYISPRIHFARSLALWLSDRLIIFLFIFIPTSVISLLVVIVRNLN